MIRKRRKGSISFACTATGNLVGAYHYKKYLLPIHKELTTAIDGPECAIPLSTPMDNLKAIVAAVHEGY